jgi:hypothetical protein
MIFGPLPEETLVVERRRLIMHHVFVELEKCGLTNAVDSRISTKRNLN